MSYLTKNPFFNMKSLLQHWEENMEWFLPGRINYNQFLAICPKLTGGFWKIGQFFQVTIHFRPSHLQTKMIDTSFYALVGLFLTKLNRWTLFWHQCKYVCIIFQGDTKNRHLLQFSLGKEDIFYSIIEDKCTDNKGDLWKTISRCCGFLVYIA